MKHSREEQLQAFDRLLTIMSELRQKCPWDHKQTFESLRQNTIEEVNELSAQLIKKDYAEVCKELGDVLLHIVFYAEIASETDLFDIADVWFWEVFRTRCRPSSKRFGYRIKWLM